MRRMIGVIALALSLLIFCSMGVLAANPDAAILLVNLNNKTQAGQSLAGHLLEPAGYTNVTEINDPVDFVFEWESRADYDVIIISYHGIKDNVELQDWIKGEGKTIQAWVKAGGALLSTAGRDAEEGGLCTLFGLFYVATGMIQDIVLVVDPVFAEGIEEGILDSCDGPDPTPWNGDIYVGPLPSWAEYIVTTNTEGQTTMVAGSYGKGILALGGFEFTNIDTGGENQEEGFYGFPAFWKNLMDWVTS